MSVPKAPASLGAAGRRLWRDVLGRFELDPPELRVLELAGQAADDAATARVTLAAEGVTAHGRYGQPVLHPAVTVARQAEANVARLLGMLNVVDPVAKPARRLSTPGPKPLRRLG